MKILFSISFSFLILFQSISFNISDLIKIHELMEHASYHKNNHGDGLLVFISKHYGEMKAQHENESENNEEHDDLPFNHGQDSCSHPVPMFVLDSINFSVSLPEHTFISSSVFHYQEPYSSFEKPDIFQPPILA